MASLQNRNGSFRALFRYNGKLHTFTIGKVPTPEAKSKAEQIEYLLMRITQGYQTVPDDCDIVTFLKFDGKPPQAKPAVDKGLTLRQLQQRYLETHSCGTLEETTLKGIKQHFRHWEKTLGQKYPVPKLSLAELQKHVDRRAKMKGVRGLTSPATIKKEIVTLRAVWNWASQFGLVDGIFPNKGIRLPKFEEKPPFMTWTEIERQIKSGASVALWENLYLTTEQIDDLLNHVETVNGHPFIFPMFAFAAHTGARRSEMLRAKMTDVDLAGNTILIHEKKRVKNRRTHRRVPLTPFLKRVLVDWLDQHPGGQNLFCQSGTVPRSNKKRPQPTPITMDESHDHFKRTLANSRWSVLKGWHVLRHSFISACASKNVDQRLIDEWVGHTTEEMRCRYRHLYPSTQQDAIRSVFGE